LLGVDLSMHGENLAAVAESAWNALPGTRCIIGCFKKPAIVNVETLIKEIQVCL